MMPYISLISGLFIIVSFASYIESILEGNVDFGSLMVGIVALGFFIKFIIIGNYESINKYEKNKANMKLYNNVDITNKMYEEARKKWLSIFVVVSCIMIVIGILSLL